MSTSDNQTELLEHLKSYLGTIRQIESARSEEGNRGYDLVVFHREDPGITTVATNGLRFQQITSMLPEELVCTLWEAHAHIAHYLVDTMASIILRNGRGLDYGVVVGSEEPIIDETEIRAVLAHPSPYFGGGFDLFPSRDAAKLQIISLIPITANEHELVKERGSEALFEKFRENRTNLFDIRRPSAV
jgi:hypothetical protein